MRLPRIAIDNYQFTLVVFILLLLAGVQSFLNMPRTENPEIVIPGVSIFAIYPGASPVDLEELVAIPIEEAVNEIDDIKEVTTTLIDGVAAVVVRFEFDVDADSKYDEVVQKVTSIQDDLPDELMDLRTVQWTSSDVGMLQLAMSSPKASYAELEEQAELLKKDLERSFGVKKVEIMGSPKEEVRIALDLEKMASMNISIIQVANALMSNNANIPGGSLKIGDKVFGIKTSGSYNDLEQIKRTIVNSQQGRLIYLENIADVHFDLEDQNYRVRFVEKNHEDTRDWTTLFMVVKQKEGFNVLDVAEAAKGEISSFQSSLEDDIQLSYVFDQTIGVKNRVNGFLSNLLQGIFLVGLVILLAIGFKSALVVIIAIPLSIMIGLGIIDQMGYGMQQISIAALVVALGLLVDNSIVMIENIHRYMKMGYKPREASIKGASEIGWPVISATLTTVLAFIPIAMMPYETGLFIRSLPLTIIATLVVSLIIALALTPMITSRLFKSDPEGITRQGNGLQRHLKGVIEGPYRRTLNYALHNRKTVVSLSILALAISLFAFKFVGFSLFPKAEQPSTMVRIWLPEGSNLDKTDKVARYVESVLDTMPEVKYYATNIGQGNPRIYYNVFAESNKAHFAEIYVETYEYIPDEFNAFIIRLRENLDQVVGAEVFVKEFEQGSPIAAPVQIYFTGKKLEVLAQISREFEHFMREQEGIINVNNQFSENKTDIYFKINREKANMLGVPIHEIDRTIRTAITGQIVSKFRDKEGKEYDMVLRMPLNGDAKVSDFDKIYVTSYLGKSIPLKQLASFEFRPSPSKVTRYNLERMAEIQGDIQKGFTLDDAMAPVLEKLENYPFPAGYNYQVMGELQSRDETFGGTGIAAIIAIIAIFSVLVLQFRSFLQPIIIFIALPFAIIGMIWALLLTGNTFSFTAFIGLTSLIGIVVNNSILLVDYANLLRKEGKSISEALQLAGETRFTPIILTSLTTIMGLLPLTLRGGTLWAPLGWTIIGGLLVSTMLTLVMVPVFYKSFIREKTETIEV